MKYLFTLFVLSFIIPHFSLAQGKYKQGYVVTTKGDTIKGLIEYNESWNNLKEFHFKNDFNSHDQKISITNANGVGIIGDDDYEKFTTTISKGDIQTSKLSESVDTSFVTDTVFLRVVKKGMNVSLYSYTDNTKTRFYIYDNARKKISELNYYLYTEPETHSIVTVTTYRRQLITIANNYSTYNDKLVNKISSTEYNLNELYRIVQLINNSTDLQLSSKNQSQVRYFIGAGIKRSTMNFDGENLFFNAGTKVNSTTVTGSIGVDLVMNKETQKLIFRGEVSFLRNNFNIDSAIVHSGKYINTQYASMQNVKQFNIVVIPQVIYNFYSTNSLKIFMDVGIGFNFSSYNTYQYSTHDSENPTTNFIVEKNTPAFSSLWFSVPLKAGIVVNKHVEIYATYWTSASLTKYVNTSVSQGAYQGGVNYLF